MTPLATYLATEAHKPQVKRKLTEAEALALIAEYQGGAPIQPLINRWGMSQERFYRILAAAGVEQRSSDKRFKRYGQISGRWGYWPSHLRYSTTR